MYPSRARFEVMSDASVVPSSAQDAKRGSSFASATGMLPFATEHDESRSDERRSETTIEREGAVDVMGCGGESSPQTPEPVGW
jgi:hypothetical protein